MVLQRTNNGRIHATQKDENGVEYHGFSDTVPKAIAEVAEKMRCRSCGRVLVGTSLRHYRAHLSEFGKMGGQARFAKLGSAGMAALRRIRTEKNSNEPATL